MRTSNPGCTVKHKTPLPVDYPTRICPSIGNSNPEATDIIVRYIKSRFDLVIFIHLFIMLMLYTTQLHNIILHYTP